MSKIQSLNDVTNYVKINNLESALNGSFNRYQINSPKNSFYSVEKMELFSNTNKELTYKNYYDFLTIHFELNRFSDYIKKLANIWQKKDNKINLVDAQIYLLKKFVIDPVNGELQEREVLKQLRERYKDFEVLTSSPEDDLNKCYDFKLENKKENKVIYIQHKPISFFNGLKFTTKNSFNKIKTASEKNNISIFFSKLEKGNVVIYIRDINKKDKLKFIPINDFLLEKINQEQIKKLSIETFSRISKTKLK